MPAGLSLEIDYSSFEPKGATYLLALFSLSRLVCQQCFFASFI